MPKPLEVEMDLWWNKKFLGITRNDWPWVVFGVVIVVLCLSLDWDYIFGLRP